MSAFFLGTKLGRTLVLLGVVLVCWFGFRWYYIAEGKRLCQNEQANAVGKANVDTIAAQNARDSTSSTVAAESNAKSQAEQKAIENKGADRQETIRNEYTKPAAPAAVVKTPSTCVGLAPVPTAVQGDFEAAVKEINDAR